MSLKLAIMGIRGIPANYGGFETFAENLATRLVKRGHEVTVYGRSNSVKHKDRYYQGVRLVILPTIRHKYFDTVAHTFLCVWHAALKERFDAILICNSANGAFCVIPRLFGQKVAINVDGLEWQRKKWNKLGRWYYKMSEYLSTVLADVVVTDSMVIQRYYHERFHKDSVFIPYGAPTAPPRIHNTSRERSGGGEKVPTNQTVKQHSLQAGEYVLYVSRLEPENNAHLVVKAFEQVKTDKRLVVVGDAPYNTEYIQQLKATTDPRILFTGYVFGHGYKELQSNAYFYVQATEVGGTHPALLEGMGYGNCVLANDVPEHREVLGEAGLYFTTRKPNDLAEKMQFLLNHEEEVRKYGELAVGRILQTYTWEKIVSAYEKLFEQMAGRQLIDRDG